MLESLREASREKPLNCIWYSIRETKPSEIDNVSAPLSASVIDIQVLRPRAVVKVVYAFCVPDLR